MDLEETRKGKDQLIDSRRNTKVEKMEFRDVEDKSQSKWVEEKL